MNIHEQKFLNALRDIFVGAKIEGEGGFINLMRIKSRYYNDYVFPRLMDKIDVEIKEFPEFREELFDKLYSFFKRYFSESGSIYFRHTPYYQDIYERIYTDDRDVMMFWKTQNLYYVKTDRLFRSMTVQLEDDSEQKFLFDASIVARQTFTFDASTLQTKRNNEKRNLVFEYEGKDRKDDTLKFTVLYAESGKKTKTAELLREIKQDGVKVTLDQLTQAFRLFERQSEVDFFINKNAKAFLAEQFDLWMYQYLFKHESDYSEMRIREMQALKHIAYAIIDFVAQFEDELVRIWNKPKFVHSSNYIVTIDRIVEKDESLARRLIKYTGIKHQTDEWKKLGMIGDDFTPEMIFEKPIDGKLGLEGPTDFLHPCYKFLTIDTKYFKPLELEILSLFRNLDEDLDGRLINSENYQALNTFQEKLREHIKCTYIDPPYNAVATEIAYVNEYKHASWLSLMADRLQTGKALMTMQGMLCVTIDDYEFHRLHALLDGVFGEGNHLATVPIRNNPSGRSTVSGFAINHEYALFYVKGNGGKVGRLPHTDEQKSRYSLQDEKGLYEWENFRKNSAGSFREDRPKQYFPILFNTKTLSLRIPNLRWEDIDKTWHSEGPLKQDEIEILPSDNYGRSRVWRYGIDRTRLEISDVLVKEVDGNLELYKKKYLKVEGTLPRTWWDKPDYSARDNGTRILVELFGSDRGFEFPKSVAAVRDALVVGDLSEGDCVLDYFAGSGTTAHAVLSMNRADELQRRYILIESNEYFYTVIVPRVKKVVFSNKWKNGKAQADGQGISHFCKYFAMEQYEDTLRRAVYIDDSEVKAPTFFDNPHETPFSSYVFLRDPKMSDALQTDFDAGKLRLDFEKLYEDIDWAETLSCIKGKFIKTQTADSVTFADGETIRFDEIDYRDILPLIWWDK